MSEDENIDQVPKSNNTPEEVNENASQKQTIEQSKTTNMVAHHPPDLHQKRKWEALLGSIIYICMLYILINCQ